MNNKKKEQKAWGKNFVSKKDGKYEYNYTVPKELTENIRVGDIRMVAEKTGYSQSHISNMVDGKRVMSNEILNFFLRIFKVRKELLSIDMTEFKNKSNNN